jgi:TPR repeat protein
MDAEYERALILTDPKEIFAVLSPLAEAGHLPSMRKCGQNYMEGYTGEKNREKAIECFEKAIALGDTESLLWLGMLYLDSGSTEKAREFIDKAAEAGVPGAEKVQKAH